MIREMCTIAALFAALAVWAVVATPAVFLISVPLRIAERLRHQPTHTGRLESIRRWSGLVNRSASRS